MSNMSTVRIEFVTALPVTTALEGLTSVTRCEQGWRVGLVDHIDTLAGLGRLVDRLAELAESHAVSHLTVKLGGTDGATLAVEVAEQQGLI